VRLTTRDRLMLVIPELIWSNLLQEFRALPRSVEQVAYLDGLDDGTTRLVTTVAFPNANLERRSYRVSPEAMSEAGKHLRRLHLVRLAQVHTHPGVDVEHSPEDDRRAYSQESGAISIVLPDYGKQTPRLDRIGFHVREASGWKLVPDDQLGIIVTFMPSVLDFRRR
jgi:hypothetical protein